MNKRSLGRSGILVPPLLFGCNVFGWTIDEKTSHTLLDRLMDAGFNAIDTADMYSTWVPGHQGGESETIIGNWLKARGGRGHVVLCTKVGMQMGSGDKGLSRAWIMKEVEASLRRLQTDYIDLYQAHKDDPDTPLEETLEAFAALIKQGKVRAIGASNYSAPRLQEALAVSAKHGLPRYETLQPLYNLMERGLEADLGPLCLQEGVGLIPYYALAAGFLTGKYRSEADLGKSPRGGGAKKYLDARGFRVLAALDAIAARHGVQPGQVAVAWLNAQPGMTAPIASATSLAQLEELLVAARLQLTPAEVAELNAASA